MHHTLDSLQDLYKVTDREFAPVPPEKVEQAYRNFARLAGEEPENYSGYVKKYGSGEAPSVNR